MNRRYVSVIGISLVLSLLIALFPVNPRAGKKIFAESNEETKVESIPSDTIFNVDDNMVDSPIQAYAKVPTVVMPDVSCMHYEKAEELIRELLTQNGFTHVGFAITWGINHDPAKTLTVSKTEPAAGSVITCDQTSITIRLFVREKGATPSPTHTPVPTVEMPDVSDMHYEKAEELIREILTQKGFTDVGFAITWGINHDPAKTLTVVKTEPAAGSVITCDQTSITIRLYVLEKGATPSPTSAKPAVPSDVKAKAESASSIKVSWSEVDQAVGYQVWRGTSETGAFMAIGSVTTTSRVSAALAAGTTYCYKVRAYNEVEGKKIYGDFSAIVNAETLLAKPAGVKAVSASATSVDVSWNGVSGAVGYQVWRSTQKDSGFVALGSVTTTSRVSKGLITGVTYYYKVRAYKEADGKKIYGEYSAVTSAVPRPAAPSSVAAVPETPSSIKVSWNAVSGITGYQVWRGTSATGAFTAIGSVTETSRISTGLKSGTTYYYKVRAYKEVDGARIYGAFSTVVSAMPKPVAPGNVKAAVASATKVTVSWNEVAGSAGYEVYRSTSANGTYSKLGSVTTTSRACPGLTTGTTYYFKVRAYVEVNGKKYYSNFSSVVNATPSV